MCQKHKLLSFKYLNIILAAERNIAYKPCLEFDAQTLLTLALIGYF
jgi:hypothetical protein